ncbi:hypothetical protein PHYPO_G00220730 [Pangasianodon hypophthalmus]|uniref:LIM zinc-binding domain-containing protein n=1 Tax=Pangasianodon hypophthalmus TaxID=310915 RepID=A0A5N5NUN2_PANHP|nr:hypothetical protein PHYPO_G00220730 [Pangasianodon hypophthalmus]
MSTGDRQSVLQTTKVRTALKGDSSWIQRRSQSGPEEDEEKPWLAEVRASRLNSEFSDPVADNTPLEREPLSSPSAGSSKTSGYLIRGVFTKTDTKPAASSSNGYIGTSSFTKKASEEYKKIAPHTVRSNVERTEPSEPSLSAEEQERRTQAASKMLNNSAGKQRSYVLSAAKKYESTPAEADSSASSATAFIAKRVVISDDEDTGSVQLSTPVSPPKQSVEMSVDEPIPPESSSELKPRAKPQPTPKQSETLSALSDTLLSTPESTSKKPVAQVASPVPETKTVSKPKPNPKTSVNDTITQATSVAPVATLKKSATTEPKPDSTPKTSATEPVTPAVPAVKEVPPTTPERKPKPEATPKPSINPKPVEKTSALNDNDLLDLTESTPQNLVDPLPTTTDLLTGDSLPKTEKTKGSLDLLAVDIIPIDTNTDKLSTDKTKIKTEITQTVVQTKKDIKSTPQNSVNPVPTTTDLLTGSSLPKTQKTSESLDLLAYDVIPIDTNKARLSTDKTQSKVETTTTIIQTKTVEKGSADPFDPIPIVRESTKSSVELFDPLLSDSNNGQQKTVTVTFEQKSSKTSSPWDKWVVPTIDTTTEDSEPEPDPEPADDSYTAYTRTEESSFQEPDNEAKKNVVYVKSYVNSSDPPRYSTSRYDNDYDYVTSSSSSYAYSSPSSTVGMTACTYCGGLVGNDSKITIDHLNISCHPECFKCGICSKPMGDFIHSMFWHRGTVHCESCYSNVI